MICPTCKVEITLVPDVGSYRYLREGEIPTFCPNCYTYLSYLSGEEEPITDDYETLVYKSRHIYVSQVKGPWFSLGFHLDFHKPLIDIHFIWWIITIGKLYFL